jgi:hypothetical protein
MKKLYTLTLLIGIVLQSNAQVIYTDIPDAIIAGPSTTYDLDLDNGGQPDFTFWALGSFANGYTHIQSGSAGPSSGILESATAEVQNVPFGNSIGSSSSTWNPVTTDMVFVFFVGAAMTTDFLAPNEIGYVGCRFTIGANLHYGWVRVRASNTTCELTIFDYAYESTPGVPIMAGDNGLATAINENNETFITVYSSEKNIVVKNTSNQSLDLKVTNLSGQVVKSYSVHGSEAKINVEDLVPNIYIVSIVSNDGSIVLHEKLFIK